MKTTLIRLIAVTVAASFMFGCATQSAQPNQTGTTKRSQRNGLADALH
jgi:hypothetical protein